MKKSKDNHDLLAENAKLAEMCQWMIGAQARGVNPERKLNDYREVREQTESLLQHRGFMTAYTDLLDSYQRDIINSQPHESVLRETSYLKTQVLKELLLKLDNQRKTVALADVNSKHVNS
tara:strand:+ start:7484 stop:7843 length:360 start_codon:yes stop_codon:yes gene_type:complete